MMFNLRKLINSMMMIIMQIEANTNYCLRSRRIKIFQRRKGYLNLRKKEHFGYSIHSAFKYMFSSGTNIQKFTCNSMQRQFEEYRSSGCVIHCKRSHSKELNRRQSNIILKTRHDRKTLNSRLRTANSKERKPLFNDQKQVRFGPNLTFELTKPLKRQAFLQKKMIEKKRTLPMAQQICRAHSPQMHNNLLQCNETLLNNSSKLKLIYNNNRQNLQTVLVLSAEFLLNEFSFWKDDMIATNITRVYKTMSHRSGIVWLVKKQKTALKIIEFCNKNLLPLDSIFLIEKSSRKINLSVNYDPIIKNMPSAKSFLAFDITRDSSQIRDYRHLENKLPITVSTNVRLYLINTDKEVASMQLLQNVCQIVLGSLQVKRSNIDKAFDGYAEYLKNYQDDIKACKKKRKASVRIIEEEEQVDPEEEVRKRIEELKRKWIPKLNTNKKSFTGQSVHYIVGDLLKRNFKLMVDLHNQWSKQTDVAECTTAATSLSRRYTANHVDDVIGASIIHYETPVYICCI